MNSKVDGIIHKRVKRHGCICPFQLHQLITYAFFFLLGFCFYFINVVAWSQSLRYLLGFTIPYTLLFLCISVLTLVITLNDPTDPLINKTSKSTTYS